MLSSKGEAKHDERVASRLDVLMERVDTLAATVATTASAMAKKDGEIAALRRDLQARDDTVQALVAAQTRTSARTPTDADAVDANELRSLRNAVAALTKERAGGGLHHVTELSATVRSLQERVNQLAAAASTDRHSEELRTMLTSLRSQVEAIGDLRSSAIEQQLSGRLAGTDEALAQLGDRVDSLASSIEAATTNLAEKERELAALHQEFTESSTRIESIVDDIRDALSALPEPGSPAVDDLVARVDQLEQRVATVATEVSRAKTLWPVALRSLEARLDDAIHPHRPAEPDTGSSTDVVPADDLLAGLRDSLQAMETVAEEMARASDVLALPEESRSEPEPEIDLRPDVDEGPLAASGGTIVPLRAGEP